MDDSLLALAKSLYCLKCIRYLFPATKASVRSNAKATHITTKP